MSLSHKINFLCRFYSQIGSLLVVNLSLRFGRKLIASLFGRFASVASLTPRNPPFLNTAIYKIDFSGRIKYPCIIQLPNDNYFTRWETQNTA